MKKQRIPWEKAPKIDRHVLVGHSFNQFGEGKWHYMTPYYGRMIDVSKSSDIKMESGMHWESSFTPAPRRRK